MEKIVCELMKSESPHSEATHRKIAYMLGTKPRIVESWANRFKESLEQAQMLRNQIAKMVHPETQELLERQKREAICPLPTAAEWREADARSLAAQFGTSEDKPEQGKSLEAVFAEITEMPAVEKARLQELASSRNLVAYQQLANRSQLKARP